MYPAQNRETARQMCHTPGCGILTEYLHLQEALPGLFPARNRIVAGIARATVVIEAKTKGGALITAELAGGYNREVFAVPGRANDPCSQGCNTLIRRNKAMILDDPQTLIEELGLSNRKSKTQPGRQSEIPLSVVPETATPPTPNRNGASPQWEGLTEEGKKVARMLSGVEKMHLDELCTALEMPVQNLTVLLLEMELAGMIDTLPGKYYALSPQART